MFRTLLLSALCLGLAACGSTSSSSSALSDEARMAEFLQKIEPGEQHGLLNVMEGNWKAAMESRESADGPVTKSEGVASNRMILGRRFLESTFRANIPELGVFEGRGLLGYNTFKDQYESIWIDSFGTAIPPVMVSHPTDDVLGMSGEATQFDYLEQRDVKRRMVTRVLDRGTHVFTMFKTDVDGEEFVELRIVYTRL